MVGDSRICELDVLVLFFELDQLMEISLFGDCEHINIFFIQEDLLLFNLKNSFLVTVIVLECKQPGSYLTNQLT